MGQFTEVRLNPSSGTPATDHEKWITLDLSSPDHSNDPNADLSGSVTYDSATKVNTIPLGQGTPSTDATAGPRWLFDIKDVLGAVVDMYDHATFIGMEFRIRPQATLPSGTGVFIAMGLAKGEDLLGNDFFGVGCRWDVAGPPDVGYWIQTTESWTSPGTTAAGHMIGQCVLCSDENDLECDYFHARWVNPANNREEQRKGFAGAVDLGNDSDSANRNRIAVFVGGGTDTIKAICEYRLIKRASNN